MKAVESAENWGLQLGGDVVLPLGKFNSYLKALLPLSTVRPSKILICGTDSAWSAYIPKDALHESVPHVLAPARVIGDDGKHEASQPESAQLDQAHAQARVFGFDGARGALG